MNTGFELMWCDFEVGLTLRSRLNVTTPDTIRIKNPQDPCETPKEEDGATRARLLGLSVDDSEPRRNHSQAPCIPPQWNRPPLAATSGYEWLRTTSYRFLDSQPHIQPITSGLVTFYDPSLTSLVQARESWSWRKHRVWNVSAADAEKALNQLEDILERDDLWLGDRSWWDGIALRIIETWGDRLAQMNDTLHSEHLNVTQAVERVRLLSFTLLNPYLDTTHLPFVEGSDPSLWLPPTLERCTTAYTGAIPTAALTPEERLLKASIETVVGRLCRFAGDMLARSLGKADDAFIDQMAVIADELLEWLNWAMWTRCTEDCGLNVSSTASIRFAMSTHM